MNCPYCLTETPPAAARCPTCTTWLTERRPVREWSRAQQGRRVAGVCAGLSRSFGVPVAALRLVFLLSVLLGGWGILLYLALWIAMPLEADLMAGEAGRPLEGVFGGPLDVRESRGAREGGRDGAGAIAV